MAARQGLAVFVGCSFVVGFLIAGGIALLTCCSLSLEIIRKLL
jgi:hypothetical protein